MGSKKTTPPAKGKAVGDYLVRWNQMLEALKNELAQNPHMQADYNALKSLKPQVEAKDAEQEMLKGKLTEATNQLKALLKDAEKHYSSLRHLLEAKFGTRSPMLKKYITTSQAEVDKTKAKPQ